jgi:hypothetical protein
MRRGFSIFLILVFGLMPLSALVDGSEDANLPACCRQHGAHHCSIAAHMAAMRAKSRSDSTPGFAIPSTCPEYPGLAAMLATPAPALLVTEHKAIGAMESSRTAATPSETMISTPARTHAGRGPPATNLS